MFPLEDLVEGDETIDVMAVQMATNQEVLGRSQELVKAFKYPFRSLRSIGISIHCLHLLTRLLLVVSNSFCLTPKRDAFHPDAKLFPGAWNGQTPHQLRQAIRPEWPHASEFWSDQRAHTSHSQRPLGKDGGHGSMMVYGSLWVGCRAVRLLGIWALESARFKCSQIYEKYIYICIYIYISICDLTGNHG